MNRRTITVATLTGLAAPLFAGLAAGYLLADTPPPSTAPDPKPARFQIINTEVAVFLLNTTTGDTWRWTIEDNNEMGWQYHDRPPELTPAP